MGDKTMSLRLDLLKRAGTFPHVYCPLCRQKGVKLIVTNAGTLSGDPQVVLEVHDIPSEEVVFDSRETHGGREAFVRVRCPASSQPVNEVP